MSTEKNHVESGQSPPAWAVCQGTRKNGSPCRAPATGDGKRCPHHADRYTAEDRLEWARRGARVHQQKGIVAAISKLPLATQSELLPLPDLSSTQAVEAYLGKIIAEVHEGMLPPSLARSINELLQTRLKLVELSQTAALLALEASLKGEG